MRESVLLFLITATLFSCKPDPCKDVDCNTGTCDSGNCICETGFEGPNCETEQRQSFVGDYLVEETCDLGSFNYTINVTADSEVTTELTIHNIGDFDFDVIGNVDGTSFTIDDNPNGATVTGTGQLANGVLTVVYTMESTGGQVINCTMTCTLIE